MTVLDEIAGQRVVPVIRSATAQDAVVTARAMARAGMRVIELTRSVPDVEEALDELRDDGLTLGVGTITEASQVADAAAAGARFAVSFGHPAGFVPRARQLGVAALPGALTPTEFASCAGADAVKLFPARLVPPAYLHDLAMVMPGLRVVVTGGVRLAAGDVAAWLEAGAIAVGLGGALGTAAAAGPEEVERRAHAALALVMRASEGARRNAA